MNRSITETQTPFFPFISLSILLSLYAGKQLIYHLRTTDSRIFACQFAYGHIFVQMNGLTGTASGSSATTMTAGHDRNSIGGNSVISMGGAAAGSPQRRGGALGGAGGAAGQLQSAMSVTDSMRKSRSQGGKKLQKCLSTASYGEELSVSRPQMAPMSYNLLMTRQYCSFGSTTSTYIMCCICK